MRTPRAEPRRLRDASRRTPCWWAGWVLAAAASPALGQPLGEAPPDEPAPVEQAAGQPGPEEPATDYPASGWPDTSVWIDDNGVPRPLIGVTYEEFANAWRQYRGIGSAEHSPRFTLHALEVETRVSDTRADASAPLAVMLEVQTHQEGPVGVPLRLGDAIFTGELEGVDPDTEHLAYDKQQGGYVLWLRGGGAGRRKIRAGFFTRVSRTTDSVRVRVGLPRASQSLLVLATDTRVIAPEASEGRLVVADDRLGGSRLEVTGAVGDTVVAFRLREDVEPTDEQAVLRSRGQLHVRIDDRSVRTTATLRVDGLGRAFNSLLVRLPAGATLLPDPGKRPRGVRVAPAAPLDGEDGHAFVSVSRADPSTEPLTIKLVAERPLGAAESGDTAVDLAGFEVVGGVLQSGDVAVSVAEGVQLDWGRRFGAEQITPAQLPDDLARQSPRIAFRYYRQAWRLPVRVGAREPRVEATPDYRLEVLADEARLTMEVDYRVYGAGVFEFAFDLNGWRGPTDDPVGPVGLVDAAQVHTVGGRLVVPLTRATGRRDTLTLRLRRPLRGPGRYDFALPTPVADARGGGRLTLVADPGVSLSVLEGGLVGLEPRAVEPAPGADEDPAAIRTRAFRVSPAEAGTDEEPKPTLAAAIRRRPRRLLIDSRAKAMLGPDRFRASQMLRCTALYQPVERLLLLAPRGVDLGAENRVSLTADPDNPSGEDLLGVPLTVTRAGEADRPEHFDADEFPGMVMWVAPLPGPRLGVFGLSVRFADQPALPAGGQFDLPLVTPVMDDREAADWRTDVATLAPPGLTLEPDDPAEGWRAVGAGGALRLVGDQASGPLRLRVARLAEPDAEPDARVEQAWFQTWDAGGELQTRAVYRVVGSTDKLGLVLPRGVDPSGVEVLLDGKAIPLQATDDGYQLRDESLADGGPHTVATRLRAPRGDRSRTRLEPPRPVANGEFANCFWEVVQPADRHALTAPDGFSGYYRWGWRGGWGRQPLLDSAAIARMLDAEPGPSPSAGEHRYLYRSFGLPEGAPVVRSVGRAALVFALSAGAVAIGFVVSQLKLLRYPTTYYVSAAAVAALGVLAPWPALFLLQASAVGIALTAVTLLADHAVRRARHSRRLVLAEQSTSFGPAGLRLTGDEPVSTNAPTASVPVGDAASKA